MDIITGSQESESVCIPIISLQEASQLFTKLYNLQVDQIKPLPGYAVKNFYIRTVPKVLEEEPKECVLKVFPLFSDNMKELIEVSIAVMLYLKDCGIVCSAPVQTQDGEYVTMQEFKSLKRSSGSNGESTGRNHPSMQRIQYMHLVHLNISGSFIVHTVTYIAGELLGDACPEIVPQAWYQALGHYLAKLDKAMLSYPHRDHIPMMTEFADNCEWSLNTVPRFRALLYVVEDEEQRNLIESVINDFDKEVVPKMAQLRKGLFYGDFNDNNIIVNTSISTSTEQLNHVASPTKQQCKLEIVGLIDFNDVSYTCLLFEVGVALTYMMYTQKEGERLAVGHDFFCGYKSVLSLTDEEWQLLPVCVAGRCVQTILVGLYSHRQDPTNEYVLLDIDKAWQVIKLIKSLPRQHIVDKWKGVKSGLEDV